MTLLAIILAVIILGLFAVFVHDKIQAQHTVLRNFPVIGHFRYFAETWGTYMRQ